MVQFCYLRISFGIYIVSRRLLQWIARIANKIQNTYSKYVTDSDNKSNEQGDFEVVYGRTYMTSSGEIISCASGSMRLMSYSFDGYPTWI